MQGTTQYLLVPGARAPLFIERQGHSGAADLAGLVLDHRDELSALLLEHGALVFRGFQCDSVAAFDRFVGATGASRMDYVYSSTPRTLIGERIFTSTEYPAEQEILLHNENAYQRAWPLTLAFCCLVPATSGGATPLADLRRVGKALGEDILDAFEARLVQYVRHYRPYMDLRWQRVFHTEDPAEVSRFCDAHDISHEWLDAETLRTAQICQGTARHPHTGERVFFNQAHLFHVSSLGPEDAAALIELFGEDRLPRHACFGDGAQIPLEMLDAVRDVFRREAVEFSWRAGDVMWIDNMQVAHGRRSFRGARKVIAALMDGAGLSVPNTQG